MGTTKGTLSFSDCSKHYRILLELPCKARDRNKKAAIVVRCYLDEFTEILEGLGANEVISSSKSAFNEIATHIGAPR